VCNDTFGVKEAAVFCRSIGFKSGRATSTDFSSSAVPIKSINCRGDEKKLSECSFVRNSTSCEGGVFIQCSTEPDPEELSLRLAGNGADCRTGRLETYHNGEWGSVCDEQFNIIDAAVACRELGFKSGRPVGIDSFGPGTGPILMSEPICFGEETKLASCRHEGGTHKCSHASDVAVECSNDAEQPMDGAIRLAGTGATKAEGRLEILKWGEWGTVCAHRWDTPMRAVACLQLGFASTRDSNKSYGTGTGRIWLAEVDCVGNETELQMCSHPGWGRHNCTHESDVAIMCSS